MRIKIRHEIVQSFDPSARRVIEALRLTPVDGEGVWTGPYLQSFAYTIGGGTTDIQRNIVGERVLGLPRA